MQKIGVSGIVLLLVILSLAILPQVSLGQIPTLDKLNLDKAGQKNDAIALLIQRRIT